MRKIDEIEKDYKKIVKCAEVRNQNKCPEFWCVDCPHYVKPQFREIKLELIQAILGDTSISELKDIMTAKNEGRLVMLPCKVGDMLYWFDQFEDEIYESDVISIDVMYGKYNGKGVCWWYAIDSNVYCDDDFGKTVFLAREQAEAKLKEMEGKKDV